MEFMKRIFVLAMMVAATCSTFAQQRSESQCQDIARKFLQPTQSLRAKVITDNGKGKMADGLTLLCSSREIFADAQTQASNLSATPATRRRMAAIAASGAPQFYVYGHNNGAPGFVIVSANANAHEVLGYSTTDNFDFRNLPDAAREMLSIYAERSLNGDLTTENLTIENHTTANHTTANPLQNSTMRKAPATEVKPLLGGIAFNQGTPYNNQCPVYSGQRCAVGCTGVAMSQIMAYHQSPARMNTSKGNISYTTNTYKIGVNWNVSNAVFDWDNLKDCYYNAAPVLDSGLSFSNESDFTFSEFSLTEYDEYISAEHFLNTTSTTFNGKAQLLLADEEGYVVGAASKQETIEDLGSKYYYYSFYFQPVIDPNIADGQYYVYVATKRNTASQWSVASKQSGGVRNIPLIKHGNTFTLLGKEFRCGYTVTEAKAVSTLCASCAYSIKCDFGPGSTTGTYINVANAFIDYMNYTDRIMNVAPVYFSKQGWHDYIQNELTSKRPIYVSGSAKDENMGHAFVIDGYSYQDGVPYYHVNWGWNGMSNGNFLIDYMKPSEAGTGGYETNYGEEVYILCNVRPKYATSESNQLASTEVKLYGDNVNVGDNILISAYKLSNRSFTPITSTKVYAYVVDAHGREYELGQWIKFTDLPSLYYYDEFSNFVSIPLSIPTGDYTLRLRSLDNGCSVKTTVLCPASPKLHILNPTPVESLSADAQRSNERYDLGGRKVLNSKRGIVVEKGRKVLTK